MKNNSALFELDCIFKVRIKNRSCVTCFTIEEQLSSSWTSSTMTEAGHFFNLVPASLPLKNSNKIIPCNKVRGFLQKLNLPSSFPVVLNPFHDLLLKNANVKVPTQENYLEWAQIVVLKKQKTKHKNSVGNSNMKLERGTTLAPPCMSLHY